MNSPGSSKRNHRIQKELANLQTKKQKILRKLHETQALENKFRTMTTTLSKLQSRQLQIHKELELSSARLSILQAKLSQYKNTRLDEVFKLQSISIKREQLQSLTVEAFTPQPSILDELRLKLIEIESGQQLKNISHVFTVRKALISFMKSKGLKWEGDASQGAQIYLCQEGKVGQFEQYVLMTLQQKKLAQFKLAILEPIRQYISILYQIKSAIYRTNMPLNSPFDQHKAKKLVEELRQIQKSQRESCELLKQLSVKVERTHYKAQRYREYMAQLQQQKYEAEREIQRLSMNTKEISQNRANINNLAAELRQISEAIGYLSLKISMGQNLNCLNSPKTRDLISRCQDKWGSPVSIDFRQ